MLESRARARSGSVAEAIRSKIVLSLAAGNSQAQTSRTVGCSVNTVRLWKERFLGERLSGLYGRHRGRSRSKESIRLEARVLRIAQRKPADGSTHWSTRKIAAEVGTNHVRVTRIVFGMGSQDDKTSEPLGPDSIGSIMFDQGGRFMRLIARPGLPKFAANKQPAAAGVLAFPTSARPP